MTVGGRSARYLLLAAAGVLALGAAGCGKASSATGAVAAARVYVDAVLSRDGKTLCPLLDAATRHSIDRVIVAAKTDPTFRGPDDCAHVIRILIGYPHENMGYRFTGGKLISIGRSREATVGAHRYVGVDVRVSLRTEANASYAPMGQVAPSPTVTDTVWLARSERGRWRTAKASLTLAAALNGDVLGRSPMGQALAHDAVQPPQR